MEPETRPQTVEHMHARFLVDALLKRAERLHNLGVSFRALANRVGDTRNYHDIAEEALSLLTSAIAHDLLLDRVVNEAASADIARAKGE